jgi:hypothetical protein
MRDATSEAEDAADAIDNMTVTSEMISVGQSSAEISDEDNHKNIHFRIRKGDPGSSYTIKGHAYATLSDLISDITYPNEGDLYNVGTAAPYNVYRWTGQNWEDQGETGITFKSISDEEIDDIFNSISVTDASNKFLSANGVDYYTNDKILPIISNKVDKIAGKGLSTNDFTDSYKSQVDANKTSITVLSNNKVDKISGKALSTNDFTNTYKSQIDTNKTDIANLKTDKLNAAIEGYSPFTPGSLLTSVFPIRYNSETLKITGSQLLTDILELGAIITQYNVATVSETATYLGIS